MTTNETSGGKGITIGGVEAEELARQTAIAPFVDAKNALVEATKTAGAMTDPGIANNFDTMRGKLKNIADKPYGVAVEATGFVIGPDGTMDQFTPDGEARQSEDQKYVEECAASAELYLKKKLEGVDMLIGAVRGAAACERKGIGQSTENSRAKDLGQHQDQETQRVTDAQRINMQDIVTGLSKVETYAQKLRTITQLVETLTVTQSKSSGLSGDYARYQYDYDVATTDLGRVELKRREIEGKLREKQLELDEAQAAAAGLRRQVSNQVTSSPNASADPILISKIDKIDTLEKEIGGYNLAIEGFVANLRGPDEKIGQLKTEQKRINEKAQPVLDKLKGHAQDFDTIITTFAETRVEFKELEGIIQQIPEDKNRQMFTDALEAYKKKYEQFERGYHEIYKKGQNPLTDLGKLLALMNVAQEVFSGHNYFVQQCSTYITIVSTGEAFERTRTATNAHQEARRLAIGQDVIAVAYGQEQVKHAERTEGEVIGGLNHVKAVIEDALRKIQDARSAQADVAGKTQQSFFFGAFSRQTLVKYNAKQRSIDEQITKISQSLAACREQINVLEQNQRALPNPDQPSPLYLRQSTTLLAQQSQLGSSLNTLLGSRNLAGEEVEQAAYYATQCEARAQGWYKNYQSATAALVDTLGVVQAGNAELNEIVRTITGHYTKQLGQMIESGNPAQIAEQVDRDLVRKQLAGLVETATQSARKPSIVRRVLGAIGVGGGGKETAPRRKPNPNLTPAARFGLSELSRNGHQIEK